MSDHESPMLKASRQMSDARAHGYNTSGTMAGQVGADAAQRERNAQKVHATPARSSGGYSGGGGGGGGGIDSVSDFFRLLFGGAISIAGLWFLGPVLLPWVWSGIVAASSALGIWAADRALEAGAALLGWAPDIAGYLVVVALSLIAMYAFALHTGRSILLAAAFWLGALAGIVFMLLRWHDPSTEFSWTGAAVWAFPVYGSLLSTLTLPLVYRRFCRNSFGENLSRAFTCPMMLLAIFSIGMVCVGFGIGQPHIIAPGVMIIIGASALLAGLMITSALATLLVGIAQD
ncbi:hypothetical protein VW29_19350 [Devosia limi DSM 17137]|uniref:Uncharacterized protein n=1 Tax=Devosia limi DSM 17137 TaxID=1121477 RepID=A0A0F5L3M4_9HYPH|nr:hypothetical protein [Devosia limi]KKB76804.1 hypothetical protein VW29_19350 [Devosia limi DSM 17137]SHF29113.1 hypothetical protein SAMN02745223_02233 [Devosia limi DSM 17137]